MSRSQFLKNAALEEVSLICTGHWRSWLCDFDVAGTAFFSSLCFMTFIWIPGQLKTGAFSPIRWATASWLKAGASRSSKVMAPVGHTGRQLPNPSQ
ncbi:MAG: hypothetical protein WBI82_11135 [Sphaerochaeta sp.]